MKRLLALALLAGPFLLLQACVTEPDPEEIIVTIHDTVTVHDTVVRPDTAHILDGVWLITRSIFEWTEDGVTERDTFIVDTANAYMREFYVIRGEALFWVRYDGDEFGGTWLTRFRRIGPTQWIIADEDTVNAVRTGDKVVMEVSGHDTYIDLGDTIHHSYHVVVDMVLHTGAFPPPAWYLPPQEESEPNDSPAQAVAVTPGSPPVAAYLTAGDQDWYSFPAVAGQAYLIRTFGSTDTYLELYNTAGTTVLRENDDFVGFNAGIEWICPASGTYYFRVTGYGGTSTGPYTVSVAFLSGVQFQAPASGALPKGAASPSRPPYRPHPLHPGKVPAP